MVKAASFSYDLFWSDLVEEFFCDVDRRISESFSSFLTKRFFSHIATFSVTDVTIR